MNLGFEDVCLTYYDLQGPVACRLFCVSLRFKFLIILACLVSVLRTTFYWNLQCSEWLERS